jgi:hypothetical protein
VGSRLVRSTGLRSTCSTSVRHFVDGANNFGVDSRNFYIQGRTVYVRFSRHSEQPRRDLTDLRSVFHGDRRFSPAPGLRAGAATASRRIGLEDLLHAESLESAWFSPDSRVSFTCAADRPSRRPIKAFFDPSSCIGRVMVADVATSQTREIRAGDGRRYHPVMPFQSGCRWSMVTGQSRVLLTEALNGSFGLAYWSAASDRIVSLPGRPGSPSRCSHGAGDQLIYAPSPKVCRSETRPPPGQESHGQGGTPAWEGPGAAPTGQFGKSAVRGDGSPRAI